MSTKPLSGIRILDLTRLFPGPLCTLHLGDLGADVIKIEDTHAGDYARHSPPLQKNLSSFFLAINRNKRSLVLDLSVDKGKKIFMKLTEKADVIIESFRPGVMQKLGIDYQTIHKINPKIIYCSITGYGQSGTNKDKAGHDLNFIAEAGVLHRNRNEKPQIPNFQIGDIVGGSLNAAMGIMAAIIQRGKTGEGQYLDVSIYDGLISHSVIALSHMKSKETLGFETSGMLYGDLHSYNIYETKDHRFIALAALEFKFWQRFCIAANKTQWLSKHIVFGPESQKLKLELSDFFSSKNLAEWMEVFKDSDCCLSPVASLEEALENKTSESENVLLTQKHSEEGIVPQFFFPIKFSGIYISYEKQAPVYGENSAEILRETGFSEQEISIFIKEKIII